MSYRMNYNKQLQKKLHKGSSYYSPKIYWYVKICSHFLHHCNHRCHIRLRWYSSRCCLGGKGALLHFHCFVCACACIWRNTHEKKRLKSLQHVPPLIGGTCSFKIAMKTIFKPLVIIALLISGCRGVVVEKPAQRQATMIPDSPGPTFVWVGDSWNWNNQSQLYVFQEGRWAEPKKSNAVWVDGYWKKTRGGWKWVRGYWKRWITIPEV